MEKVMRTITLRTRDGHPIFYGQAGGIVDFLNNLEPERHYNLDLTYLDLRALEWNGRKGHDIDFMHANLCGANITESIFEDCDFSFALLPYLCAAHTRFIRCNFYETEFGATDVSGCEFEACSFSGPGFFRLDLSTADKIQNCFYKTDKNQPLKFQRSPLILHGHKSPFAFFEHDMVCAASQKLYPLRTGILETQSKINQGLL
jgi:hypothetical protein